jgi:hypothetical protein
VKLLYEPWNLGDAIIAASAASACPETIMLACNSRWHEVLTLISRGSLRLIPLDLPYVWRSHQGWYDLSPPPPLSDFIPESDRHDLEVISIRGDLRDWISARRTFKEARFRFSGWIPYLARWIAPLDLPYRYGMLPVRNRYRAWATAAGVPSGEIERQSRARLQSGSGGPVVIHLGAQWRSKQYPHVAELAALLEKAGHRVEMLAGPEDPLPPGIGEDVVTRPRWPELVQRLAGGSFVITNDSGPMHLAAYLGCRTLALSRCSNITEWLPPGARALSSPAAPRGYTPVRKYWSDAVLPGWRRPEEVVALLKTWNRQVP